MRGRASRGDVAVYDTGLGRTDGVTLGKNDNISTGGQETRLRLTAHAWARKIDAVDEQEEVARQRIFCKRNFFADSGVHVRCLGALRLASRVRRGAAEDVNPL